MLRRSASNAWHGSFLRQPTHSTSAFSSEGFVQQALHVGLLMICLFLLHIFRRSASNASHGNFWRHPTHSTSASSWEGRPPSTPCALPITPAAAFRAFKLQVTPATRRPPWRPFLPCCACIRSANVFEAIFYKTTTSRMVAGNCLSQEALTPQSSRNTLVSPITWPTTIGHY